MLILVETTNYMSKIKIEFYYNGEPYDYSLNRFDEVTLRHSESVFQDRYSDFSDDINKENGWLKLILSKPVANSMNFHLEPILEGVSDELSLRIQESLRNNDVPTESDESVE